MERVSRLREEIERADLAEVIKLLGYRVTSTASGNAELDVVIRSHRVDDQRLIRFLGRRAYRLEWYVRTFTQLYPARKWAPL